MRLWIRADASPAMGLGHVMRMLAVAESAHARSMRLHFVVGGTAMAREAVESRGFASTFVDADPGAWLDAVGPEDIVVFDGYHLDRDLLYRASRIATCVGAVDDFEGGDLPVHVLLNQNPVASPRYELAPGAITLIGPRYALVRREFRVHRRDRGGDAPRTLLITMGGTDVAGLTQRAIRLADRRAGFDRLLVVVGPAADPCSGQLPAEVDLVRAPDDVASVFSSADAAISAAGSTTWELLELGLPTAVVQVADNQRNIGPGVAREGAGIFMGAAADFTDRFVDTTRRLADPEERRRLSGRALELVDGRGADRFIDALLANRVTRRGFP